MTITIKDIAKASKYSVATVSRVVGNYGYVSEGAREKIMQYCNALGYRPDTIARSMIKRHTNSIGLVITDIHNPFYIDLIDAVEEYANTQGYTILLCNTNENIEKEINSINTLVERKVDGIILVPVSQNYKSNTSKKAGRSTYIHDLFDHKIPFVFVDRYIKDVITDTIVLDNERITYEATLMLVDKGFKDIALLSAGSYISSSSERIQGYLRALKDRNIKVDKERIFTSCITIKDAFDITMELLEKSSPQAIFALDNMLTVGALKAIAQKKLIINKDVYLMCFDDLEIYRDIIPYKIATITQPVKTMGKLAASLLIDRIKNNTVGNFQTIRLDGKIIMQ